MINFLKLFFIVVSFCYFSGGNAFFEIIEVMPNTTDDKTLEYITLKNISPTAHSLSGYILSDKKKQYAIPSDVFLEPGERREFFRPETKLILNNSNEEIYLHSPQGEIIDAVEYETSTK
jgi:hypothetical protein